MTDVIKKDNIYYFVDNENFKFIKTKNNNLIDFILNETDKTPITKEDLFNKAKNNGICTKNLDIMLNKLIDNNILKNSYFPEGLEFDLSAYPLLENTFDSRYGGIIASYENRECGDYNRFSMFDRLQNAHITIIGVGGVGSHIAVMAAATGIGQITLIDNDVVEYSNLTRQLYYKEHDCNNIKKTTSLKKYLNGFNSKVKVNIVNEYIDTTEKANRILNSGTIIIQTADRPRGILNEVLNNVCVNKKIPIIYCMNSTVGPFYIPNQSGCYQCYQKHLGNTNEIYSMLNEIALNQKSIFWPSNTESSMLAAFYIFGDLINFLLGNGAILTKNAILKLNKFPNAIEKVTFGQYENCVCYRENSDETKE